MQERKLFLQGLNTAYRVRSQSIRIPNDQKRFLETMMLCLSSLRRKCARKGCGTCCRAVQQAGARRSMLTWHSRRGMTARLTPQWSPSWRRQLLWASCRPSGMFVSFASHVNIWGWGTHVLASIAPLFVTSNHNDSGNNNQNMVQVATAMSC